MNSMSVLFVWCVVVLVGIAAGIASCVVFFSLWWLFWVVLLVILYRDARLTAAIVMGQRVLPPPASFDATVSAVAAVIHFALSILYTLALAVLVARRPLPAALMIGLVFGAALFAINMYLFTALFPWFAVARDWITLAAHLAYGLSAAGFYRLFAAPRSRAV